MTRTTGAGILVATVLLAIAACGAGPDDAGDSDPEPSPEQTRSSSGPATACTVVDRDVVEPLNPTDQDLVNTLLIGDLTFDGCTVGDVYSVSFGIRVVEGGQSLREYVETVGDGESEPVDDLGDEAFRSEMTAGGEPVTITIGVHRGAHEIILRNDSPGNSDPDKRVSEDAMMQFLGAYVEAVPDDFEAEALTLLVGDGCVAQDAPAVTDLIGDVQLARGGYNDDSLRCTYLGEDLSTVQLSRSSTDDPAQFLESKTPPTWETLAIEGTVAAVANVSDGSVEVTVQPTDTEVAFVTARSFAGDVELDAVRVLAEAFLTQ